MLELKNVRKTYIVGDFKQNALNGISIKFRRNEFVAIVGASGSGKTTTLNIIGGLDRYDEGDLIIKGTSTKQFKDSDWDAYRNTSIGFVFQSYNLITHITVLDNVEMGMTLSGLNPAERRQRALEVLDRVGLSEHVHKRPNQLSGGQMQRVAIARALSNDPEIIMADEPTGALDSKTSIQIMELIREIAKDKLVILVTHNSEIAHQYANRIVQMKDGNIIDDSNPLVEDETNFTYKLKRTAMSFLQALKLSYNNIRTKLKRTLITAFAGSIGIIGVALVLSLSAGLNVQISDLQGGTLADFPLLITQTTTTFTRPADVIVNENTEDDFPDGTTVFVRDQAVDSVNHTNIFTDDFINYLNDVDPTLVNEISYVYGVSMNLLTETDEGTIASVSNSSLGWSMLPGNGEFVQGSYDLLAGEYPDSRDELVMLVDTYNQIDVRVTTALGIDPDTEELSFDDIIGRELKMIDNDDFYVKSSITNLYSPNLDKDALFTNPNATTLRVAGIIRVNPDAPSSFLQTRGIYYLPDLAEFALDNASTSSIAVDQLASDTNVITGQPLTETQKNALLRSFGADTTPFAIRIYSVDFEAKEAVKAYVDAYNEDLEEDDQIIYTDLAETITSTIGTFVDTITYVLVAFSAISLLVSSIMIGIITYISVLERTKEIGILRSLGARKRDISRVFIAETVIVGFVAGIMGVGIAYILTIPINIVITNLVPDIKNLAQLEPLAIFSLITISILLTFVAGLIPSSIAAKKDPVEALRTD